MGYFREFLCLGSVATAICKDSSPNINNGKYNNVTRILNGQVGCANNFNGSISSINIPNNTTLKPTKELSLSLWINPSSIMKDWESPLANAWDNSTNESGFSFSYVKGKLRFLIKTAGMAANEWNSNPGFNVATGLWQYVAGTYDGSIIRYYVNGDQKETKTASGNINWDYPPQGFYIGKFQDNNEIKFYNGKIDEVRISLINRSADWLWASQQTMASNNLFTSYVIP